MPRHPRTAAACLLAALALSPFADAAKDRAGSSSLITDARGLTFSGYERGGAGRRRWTLTADTATPADAAGKRWTIAKLNLATFDETGKPGILVLAPSATFDQPSRSAADPGPITLTGDRVALTGKNWSWNALENHDNRIEIRESVSVTLTPTPATGDKRGPIRIDADGLVAVSGAKGDMSLTFAGDVRVRSEEVTLRADTITTRVSARSAGAGIPTVGRAAVDSITAEGGVKISRKGGVITGDRAVMTPATGVYAVTGNARFTDLSDRRVSVTGGAMRYDTKAHRVVVSPGDDGRVHAELPALDNRRGLPGDDARATASAQSLAVELTPTNNRLVLAGEVRVDDPLNTLRCARLAVETPRRETEFASLASPAGGVTRVLAEEAVEFTRDGRILRCDRVEILPPTNRVTLTGSPRGEDPVHRATIEAALITLNTAEQTLTAESAPGRRVRVTLADRKPGGATPYAMEADLMQARRHAEGALFEFEDAVTLSGKELSGSCDRLGIEVEGKSAAATAGRVRRIVAAGRVTLKQAAYTAAAARAEILPGAALREIIPAEANGLDGKSPFFVTLESDAAAGVRTRVTLPAPATPRFTESGPLVMSETTPAGAGELALEADFQELVAGSDRLRAFARGGVTVASPALNGSCGSLEMRAVTAATETAERRAGDAAKFVAEAIVARGDVRMTLGERRATGDTLEILPIERSITLIGQPSVTGWPTPAGVARKTIRWAPVTDASGQTATRIRLADEAAAGMPGQIIRPRLTLPAEMSADLGRSFRKSLDKKAP